VARVSVESRAFGSLPVAPPAHEPIPHEATPGELLAIAYGMFLSVALSKDLVDAGTPADEIVVDAACTFDGPAGHRRLESLELTAAGRVPGLDQAAFRDAVTAARARALRAAGARDDLPGRLDAVLE
jgi:osmotically inducible protein OsmC